MPTISTFYGLVILMFWDDHNPPHFHARYGRDEALVAIEDSRVIAGSLPRRALRLVMEWTDEHRTELMENWTLCKSLQQPRTIAPLT